MYTRCLSEQHCAALVPRGFAHLVQINSHYLSNTERQSCSVKPKQLSNIESALSYQAVSRAAQISQRRVVDARLLFRLGPNHSARGVVGSFSRFWSEGRCGTRPAALNACFFRGHTFRNIARSKFLSPKTIGGHKFKIAPFAILAG
jgi:hypothetical protein